MATFGDYQKKGRVGKVGESLATEPAEQTGPEVGF